MVVPKDTVSGVPALAGVPIVVGVFAAANAHVIRLQKHLQYKSMCTVTVYLSMYKAKHA